MSNSTQNDWEKRFDEKFTLPNVNEGGYTAGSDYNPNKPRESMNVFVKPDEIKDFIRKERADARKEVIQKILFTMPKAKRKDKEGFPESANMAYYLGEFDYEIQMRQLLTTLREEEGDEDKNECNCDCTACRDCIGKQA